VVYVDNDPLVLVHARALLTSSPEGVTAYLDVDVHDPPAILSRAAEILDLTQPVAVMLLGVMGNVADTGEAYRIVKQFVDGVPSGSYLVVNDGTSSGESAAEAARQRGEAGDPYYLRSPEQIARFLDGLDLVEPGVVSTPLWRPEPGTNPVALGTCGGVARKP
jgi:hypothetical protein